MRTMIAVLCASALCIAAGAAAAEEGKAARLTWKECVRQKAPWFAADEAVRVADNLLLYQRSSGGWPKNIDMAAPLSDKEKADLAAWKNRNDSTIDNSATYTEMAFLAKVYAAGKQERFKDAFLKGLDYLLKAQYENGGWPQFYPDARGYHAHITFNDDAMIGVMKFLRDAARKDGPYALVDAERRAGAEKAVARGIECILKCQVVVDGKRTAWCAQHDETTLKPASARAYEKISLSGAESVGIVRFLMGVEKPGPEVIEAIQSAVAWFDAARVTGIKQVAKPAPSLPGGYDKVIEKAPSAPPLWARFYEIGTNRPIFCGRDGVIKYSLAEIEHERRTGYAWYVGGPADLLAKDYPAWQARWDPARNVLNKQSQ
jgi:PelA/Pel-15E family pectate lyase